MPTCDLVVDGKCVVNLKVSIQGTERDIPVLIDTGFTRSTGHGLKIPAKYANDCHSVGYARVDVADGRKVSCISAIDIHILSIDDKPLSIRRDIPTLFMDGPQVLGMMFLERCVLHIDGPNGTGSLEH